MNIIRDKRSNPLTTVGHYLAAVAALTTGGAFLLALFALGPWLLFWSIGVLFGHTIPFTFWTWLAAVVFLGLVRGGGSSS